MSVFYYSQTGTAEDFAQRLANDGKQYGLYTKVYDVEDYDTDNFVGSKHSLIVFCVATYGEGEPPEMALQFHEWLTSEERSESLLNGSKFAVFGLGDRTYDFFNKMGKIVDKQLSKLGAERIHERGQGDANANIEDDFLKWKKTFWISAGEVLGLGEKKQIKLERKTKMNLYGLDECNNLEISKIRRWIPEQDSKQTTFDIRHPFLASITKNVQLHSKSSERSCRHIEIKISPHMTYESGDHLAIFPKNPKHEIERLLKRLNTDPNQIISLTSLSDSNATLFGPCTVYACLESFYDILSPPKKVMLTMLADYSKDPEENKKLISLSSDDPEEQEYYNNYILSSNRTISELLEEFPLTNPPLDHFLEVLPRLQPRYYSISSSPHTTPDHVHITVALVEFKTSTNRIHNGIASTWLSQSEQISNEDDHSFPMLPIFIRKSTFHLPDSINTPIIMIGPGTGIAPFRGFIYERYYQSQKFDQKSTNLLFFGCRHPEQDFIYSFELESFKEKQLLELHVAFSRLSETKCYVQHIMIQDEISLKIYNLIKQGAIIYVCGDAKNMAKDVNISLKHIISKHDKKSEEESNSFVESLRLNNKYLCDVW